MVANLTSTRVQQPENFLTASPILRAFLTQLRKINGIKHKEDIWQEQRAQLAVYFFLLRNDYLFYLTATNQTDKILELFSDKKMSARDRQLLMDIRREHQKAIELGRLPPVIPKTPITATTEPFFKWADYAKLSSSLEMYHCLDKEYKRLNVAYQKENIQIYHQAINHRVDNLAHIIADKRINPLVRQEAQVLHAQLASKKLALDALHANQHLPHAGYPDANAFLKKTQDLKAEYEASNKDVESFLSRFKDEPHMAAHIAAFRGKMAEEKRALDDIHAKYAPAIEKVKQELAALSRITVQDLHHDLNHIIELLKKSADSDMSIEDKQKITLCLKNLTQIQAQLKQPHDFDTVKQLTQDFAKELSNIEDLLEPGSPLSNVNNQYQILKDKITHMTEHDLAAGPVAPAPAIFFEVNHMPLPSAPPAEDVLGNAPMQVVQPAANAAAIPEENHPAPAKGSEKMVHIKAALHDIKQSHGLSEEDKALQAKLNLILKSIKKTLSDSEPDEEYSPETKQLIDDLQQAYHAIANKNITEVQPADLQSIEELTQKLSEEDNFSTLTDIHDDLIHVVEKLECKQREDKKNNSL